MISSLFRSVRISSAANSKRRRRRDTREILGARKEAVDISAP